MSLDLRSEDRPGPATRVKKKKKKKHARRFGTGPRISEGFTGPGDTTTTAHSSSHGAVMVALSRMQAF